MVCAPLPRTVGSIVIDHVESPSPGVMVVVLPMRVSPSYRFTVVVAGSVVPLIVKSSQSVTDSGKSVIVGGQSMSILTITSFDAEDSCPSITAVATMVCSPLPRTVGSIVIDHVESPSPGVMVVVLPMRVSPSYRFTVVVAGSVVPLIVKSSQSVTDSGKSVIAGGQSKSILTITSFDAEDSCPSITAVATMVCSPLPRTVGSIVIDHVESPSPGVMVVVLPMRVSPSYRFTVVVAGSVVPLIVKSSQSVTGLREVSYCRWTVQGL